MTWPFGFGLFVIPNLFLDLSSELRVYVLNLSVFAVFFSIFKYL